MEDPQPITCEQARSLSRIALGRGLPPGIRRQLRTHWDGCAACTAHHESAAEDWIREVRAERRTDTRPRSEPIWAPLRRRSNRFALRFVVLCAVVFGISRTLGSWDADPTCRVRRVHGRAWIGGAELTDRVERAWRSDVLVTGPDGRAELELGGVVLELEPLTEVLIESSLAKRLRVMGGEITLRGTATLQCSFGVLELDGARGRLTCDEAGLVLRLEKGEARWNSALGVREVRGGQQLAAGPGRARLEPL